MPERTFTGAARRPFSSRAAPDPSDADFTLDAFSGL